MSYNTKTPKFYNNNPNLKAKNVPVAWTQDLVMEMEKCKNDPVYFTETYVKIVTKKGLVPFIMRDYQKEMLISFVENKDNIALMARQSGKTETVRAFILHYLLFNKHKTIGLLANKAATAREILGKIQVAYQHLPAWLQQGVGTFNKGKFELENGSRVIAEATSSDAIRGYTLNALVLDETAFIENFDEFYSSVYPTISEDENAKLIMISTPNGLNHFYKFWVDAIEGRNEFRHFKITWDQVPGRDEKWRKRTLAGMSFDQARFDQEMNVEFLGSSGTLIAGWKLKELVHQTPLNKRDGLIQYQLPDKKRKYAMSVDVSHGKGQDYSAFHVIDVTTMPWQQVCVYHSNNITPTDYSEIVAAIGNAYNQAMVLIEVNDIGVQVAEMVQYIHEYENVAYTATQGTKKVMVSGFGNATSVDKGIRTTKPTKATGCALLKLLIEQNQLIINNAETIYELSTFSKKGQSYEAEEGKHDDLVMGLVLFAWMSAQFYFKEFVDTDIMMFLRDKSSDELYEDMLPFGGIDRGSVFADEHPAVIDMVENPESYFNF